MRDQGRAMLIGLVGSVLLAASAWLASPWGLGFAGRDNPLPIRFAHAVPAAIGAVLLFVGWWAARGLALPQLRRLLVAWSAPLLFGPPLLSKDVWAYLDQGWIVLAGHNPYLTPLGALGGPFADRVDSYWLGTTTVYPPLALLIQAAMVALGGASPVWSMLAMRLPAVLSVLAITACLPRLARATGQDEARAVWLAVLNPLTVVHFIGGAHNDAWAVAFGVVAIWVAVRWPRWWLLGALLVGLGMAVKQPVGLMMVATALFGVATGPGVRPADAWRRVLTQAVWRLPLGLLATLAGFAIPTLASGWGLGWAAGSGAPYTAGSQAIAHTVAATLQWLTGVPMARAVGIVGPIFLAFGVAILVWLGWRYAARRPITFAAWGLVAFAFSYPSLQPWYALWGGVLLGAVVLVPRALRWVVAVTGALLATGVLLDYAGWPIPIAQLAGIAIGWGLMHLQRVGRLAVPAS